MYKLKNELTGEIIDVEMSTETSASSYGIPCWVDKNGNVYGQCWLVKDELIAPLGFTLIIA